MDTRQYSTLMDALKDIPDPRKARGKRYQWHLLLTIIVVGLASNYQSARAIAHWARLPSESTVLRVLRQIDSVLLEQRVAQFVASLPSKTPYAGCIITQVGEILQGQAIDGKASALPLPMATAPIWSVRFSMPLPKRSTRPNGRPSAAKQVPLRRCSRGASSVAQSVVWMLG